MESGPLQMTSLALVWVTHESSCGNLLALLERCCRRHIKLNKDKMKFNYPSCDMLAMLFWQMG